MRAATVVELDAIGVTHDPPRLRLPPVEDGANHRS
jgi:hypothetical protein